MPRAHLIVLDSVGIGGAEDADVYGDVGADTVGHIAEGCAAGRGDREGLRQGPAPPPAAGARGRGRAGGAGGGGGRVAARRAAGRGAREGWRQGPLHLPHLAALGLGLACEASTGRMPPNLAPQGALKGAWGYGVETSRGKDTPSGHWEITGVPVAFDWGYFPNTVPTFPEELTAALIARGNLPGILGNKHASGTAI